MYIPMKRQKKNDINYRNEYTLFILYKKLK